MGYFLLENGHGSLRFAKTLKIFILFQLLRDTLLFFAHGFALIVCLCCYLSFIALPHRKSQWMRLSQSIGIVF